MLRDDLIIHNDGYERLRLAPFPQVVQEVARWTSYPAMTGFREHISVLTSDICEVERTLL